MEKFYIGDEFSCESCMWCDVCEFSKHNKWCKDYYDLNEEITDEDIIEFVERSKNKYKKEYYKYLKESCYD